MNKSIFLSLVAIAVMTTFSACKKKKTDTPAKTKVELLTASNWKMTAFVSSPALDIDQDGNASTDLYSQLDPCGKDNLTKFNNNNKVTEDEGGSKCNPSDPQSTVNDWSFSLDESKITWDGTEYTINQLDESTMVLSYSFASGSQIYELKSTFGH